MNGRRDDASPLVCRKILHYALFALIGLPAAAAAAFMQFDAGPADVVVKVTAFSEARFLTTVRQRHDFSCGSAAVATLLTYHYEYPVSETEAFTLMYNSGDQALIRRAGFSLLDIKRFLETEGFESDGFRFPLETLKKIGVPAIVLVNDDGYKHFIVIKGVDETHVLVGDPAKGTRYLARDEFEDMWNGIVFLIRTNKNVGQRNFHIQDRYGIIARAPVESIISRDGLSTVLAPYTSHLEF
jgi:hypothetical protein